MGERFTCTLNTLRKMLRRVCFWPPTVMVETSVTLPSPGETIAPGSCGMARSGSRKNHRKKQASRHRDDGPHGARQPAEQDGGGEQGDGIQISVTDHGNIQL